MREEGLIFKISQKTHPDIALLVDPLFACGGKGGVLSSAFIPSDQLFKNIDVVVLPRLTDQVPDIKSAQAKGPMAVSADNTFFFNYYGLPTIGIPCGFDKNEMPQGLQVAGP